MNQMKRIVAHGLEVVDPVWTRVREEADAVIALSEEERQDEEGLTSLLGILWEAELGQPALLAFLEQNWLEGYDRPATAGHFDRMLTRLHAGGFIGDDARPLPVARKSGQIL